MSSNNSSSHPAAVEAQRRREKIFRMVGHCRNIRQDTIAGKLGVHRTTVSRHISRLRRQGRIEIRYRSFQPSFYQVPSMLHGTGPEKEKVKKGFKKVLKRNGRSRVAYRFAPALKPPRNTVAHSICTLSAGSCGGCGDRYDPGQDIFVVGWPNEEFHSGWLCSPECLKQWVATHVPRYREYVRMLLDYLDEQRRYQQLSYGQLVGDEPVDPDWRPRVEPVKTRRVVRASYECLCHPCQGVVHPGQRITRIARTKWQHVECPAKKPREKKRSAFMTGEEFIEMF